MAKVGFWLKGARGKFAGAVLQKGENGTISRENVTPANPRTRKQMIQRTVVKTVSAAGAQMKQLISESFEGLSPKEAVRQFQRENITILRQNLAIDIANERTGSDLTAFFLPKQVSKVIVPNAYKISDGSLTARNYGPTVINCEGAEIPEIKWPIINLKEHCPCEIHEQEGTVDSIKVKVGDFLKYFCGITSDKQQLNIVTVGAPTHPNTPIYGDKDIAAGVVTPQVFGVFRLVPVAGFDPTEEFEIGIKVATGQRNKIKEGSQDTIFDACFDPAKTETNALNAFLAAINAVGLQMGTDSHGQQFVNCDNDVMGTRSTMPVRGCTIVDIEQNAALGTCNAAALFISDNTGKVETSSFIVATPEQSDSSDENFGLDIETALASWEKSNLDFGGEGNFLEQGGEADTLPA